MYNWVWRSLVARLNGVQEAGSSNLLTQTSNKRTSFTLVLFCLSKVRSFLSALQLSKNQAFATPEVTRFILKRCSVRLHSCALFYYLSLTVFLTNLLISTIKTRFTCLFAWSKVRSFLSALQLSKNQAFATPEVTRFILKRCSVRLHSCALFYYLSLTVFLTNLLISTIKTRFTCLFCLV